MAAASFARRRELLDEARKYAGPDLDIADGDGFGGMVADAFPCSARTAPRSAQWR
jgi:hypothetical protein